MLQIIAGICGQNFPKKARVPARGHVAGGGQGFLRQPRASVDVDTKKVSTANTGGT